MPVSITCTAVNRRGSKYYVRWSDKTELEFESVAEARDYVRDILADVRSIDVLRAMVLAKALRPGAAANAVQNLPGTTATLDLTLTNVVRIS